MEQFAPYENKYDNTLWCDSANELLRQGYGGTDTLELRDFIRALRAKTHTPIDVYDPVVMSVIFPFSERLIAGISGASGRTMPDNAGRGPKIPAE